MTDTRLFDEAMKLTLGHEGGWYDGSNPRDPNPTMYGVIQKVYDAYRAEKKKAPSSVRNITQSELRDIYSRYWYGTCDKVAVRAPLTALCLFDVSINAGPAMARKLLQRALDSAEDGDVGDLDDDGKIGPQTLAAITRLQSQEVPDEMLCLWLLMERVRFYDSLANNPRLRPNLKSWLSRTVAFYDKYIRV